MSENPHEAQKSLTLEQLPPDILKQILAFDGLTRAIIRLWTSGSPLIRQNIRRSATIMAFECQIERVFAQLPILLTELTSLQFLTVRRGQWFDLTDIPGTIKLLNHLGSSLEKLVLHFKSNNIYEPISDLSECQTTKSAADIPHKLPIDIGDTYINFAKCFPKLQWLEIGNQLAQFRSIRSLPSTLTRLNVFFNPNVEIVPFPAGLIRLEVSAPTRLPKEFWPALPSGLEYLDLSNYGSSTSMEVEDLAALPRSIKRLVMSTYAWTPPTAEHIKALPPHLESLENVSNSMLQFLDGLPTRLTKRLLIGGTFGISSALSPADIRSMPRSMIALQCRLKDLSELTPSDFPSSLTYLRATWSTSYDDFGTMLPAQLRTLETRSPILSTQLISQFPKGLTELTLRTDKPSGTEISGFPPGLKCLSLNCGSKEAILHIGNLPQSLTVIELNLVISVRSLFSLPPRLRTLHIAGMTNWTDFDPKDAKTIERIGYLRSEAEKEGIFADELAPTYRPREYGVFDLLPRTLSHLYFGNWVVLEKLEPPVWQSLPKNLQTLESSRNIKPMPPDVLDYLHFDTTAPSLCLPGTTWRDEHIKRLSPHLNGFSAERCTWLITPACVPWMPYCTSINLAWPVEVQEAYKELWEKRKGCMTGMDKAGFHALDPRY